MRFSSSSPSAVFMRFSMERSSFSISRIYCFTDNNSSYIVLSLPRFCCCARYPKVLSLAKVTRPVSAGSIPVIILRRVDLPAPLIPTMAAFSWSSILNEHDFIITSVPNDLLILLQDNIIDEILSISVLFLICINISVS